MEKNPGTLYRECMGDRCPNAMRIIPASYSDDSAGKPWIDHVSSLERLADGQ
jgi:hypothetical protein